MFPNSVQPFIKKEEGYNSSGKKFSKGREILLGGNRFCNRVDADRNIIDYTAYRRPVHNKVKQAVIPLYKALCTIEDLTGMDAAENFLTNYVVKIKNPARSVSTAILIHFTFFQNLSEFTSCLRFPAAIEIILKTKKA